MKIFEGFRERLFGSLSAGDVFSWSGTLFLVTEPFIAKRGEGDEVNAVSLAFGQGCFFSDEEKVIYYPDATLLPNYKEGN